MKVDLSVRSFLKWLMGLVLDGNKLGNELGLLRRQVIRLAWVGCKVVEFPARATRRFHGPPISLTHRNPVRDLPIQVIVLLLLFASSFLAD